MLHLRFIYCSKKLISIEPLSKSYNMLRKVFCSFESLKQITSDPKKYPKLREIIIQHEKLYLDLSQESLNIEIRNPMLLSIKLLGRPTLKPAAEFQDQLEMYVKREAAGSLFILHQDEVECRTLSKRFGVCIISTQVPYQLSDVLTENFFRQLDSELPTLYQMVTWRKPRLANNLGGRATIDNECNDFN